MANELVPVYGQTYKNNHPETNVIIGDICNQEIKNLIIEKAI